MKKGCRQGADHALQDSKRMVDERILPNIMLPPFRKGPDCLFSSNFQELGKPGQERISFFVRFDGLL